jgi:hypothetical protein
MGFLRGFIGYKNFKKVKKNETDKNVLSIVKHFIDIPLMFLKTL